MEMGILLEVCQPTVKENICEVLWCGFSFPAIEYLHSSALSTAHPAHAADNSICHH